MQGMPGALQVLATLLHGLLTLHTSDSLWVTATAATGALKLDANQVREATAAFQGLNAHELWVGQLPGGAP